jgi:DNA recombination protein RmuC
MDVYAVWFAAGASLLAVGILLVLLRKLAAYRTATIEPAIRQGFSESRTEASQASRDLREEVARQLKSATDTLVKAVGELGKTQSDQLEVAGGRIKELTDSNERSLQKTRDVLDERLKGLQESNEKKLDQMRQTVDEKLQSTLERRLSESFSIVSKNLEAVQRGLGEMQSLATGVGDLKRALMNVKTRGTWGEVQLGVLLDDILTPDQFARNVQTKEGSRESVEYAIRLPGRGGESDASVWLPIDAKFPQEDYQRVLDASEVGDADGLRKSTEALSRSLQASAKEIHDKHINPPQTTDFAIMFLPTEGLYAEFLRRPGQLEEVQRVHRVVVAGPTTLSAIVTSLRVGFQTLAIEKRSSEVWRVLAAVKSEFGKFESVLAKVKRQLDTAASTIESTGVRTRAMARTLRSVEGLPPSQVDEILGSEAAGDLTIEPPEETESEQRSS